MTDEMNDRLRRVENELRQTHPNIQKIENELRVFRVEMAPLLKAYNDNQSAMRKLFWTIVSAVIMALGAMGIISFIVKHSVK